MVQNYETLKQKITDAMNALKALREEKDETAQAKSELAQIQAHIANLSAFLADQTRILAPDEAAKAAALARVNALRAKRQSLKDQKAALIADRNLIESAPSPAVSLASLDAPATGGPPPTGPVGSIAYAQALVDAADLQADYHDKALVLLKNDQTSAANSANAPAAPTGGLSAGANAYVAYDGLALLMENKRDAEVNLKALRASLATLEAEYNSHTDPPSSLQASITARRTDIETANTDLATINSNITAQMAVIANKQSDIVTARQILNEAIQDKRELLDQREILVARLKAKKDELRTVSNELQNIEGQAAPTGTPPVVDEDATVGDADGTGAGAYPVGSTPATNPDEFVSELYLAVRIYNSLTDSYAARQATIDDVTTAKAQAEADVPAARLALTAQEAEEAADQADFDLKKQTLKNALDLQATYEVNAAARVLEAFLRLRSSVLSSAVSIDASVQSDVEKTFISSKVRSAYESIKGALTSPAEYRAVLAQIQADPVGYFFNNTTDQDLSDLTPAEIEKFKKDIRDKFRVESAKVFARNGMGSTAVTQVAGTQVAQVSLLTILVILAILAILVYLFVKIVLPRMQK